jgi:hypothetical protein
MLKEVTVIVTIIIITGIMTGINYNGIICFSLV